MSANAVSEAFAGSFVIMSKIIQSIQPWVEVAQSAAAAAEKYD